MRLLVREGLYGGHLDCSRNDCSSMALQARPQSGWSFVDSGLAAHCAADCVPSGLPRMVIPSGKGRAATLKPRSISSFAQPAVERETVGVDPERDCRPHRVDAIDRARKLRDRVSRRLVGLSP